MYKRGREGGERAGWLQEIIYVADKVGLETNPLRGPTDWRFLECQLHVDRRVLCMSCKLSVLVVPLENSASGVWPRFVGTTLIFIRCKVHANISSLIHEYKPAQEAEAARERVCARTTHPLHGTP